jgi:hypothetical protein
MGQEYSVLLGAEVGIASSSAIPHLGHDPGRSETTSGSIGQIYLLVGAGFGVAGFAWDWDDGDADSDFAGAPATPN